MSYNKWLQNRENGFCTDFQIHKRIYETLKIWNNWNPTKGGPCGVSEYGAIFNLEFSPEGNIVVAACERKSVLFFDAVTTKQTNQIIDAHTDNVNCIRFLDDRLFATCSDDTTVAIWDLRQLKCKVRSLHGHSNWVKNIEYSKKDKLLITSGFDGSIFTWDVNSHTEQGLIYQKVFHTSGLMRCRIAPDGTKLILCTTGGYIMIIHSLDLSSLHKDLCGFRPAIYRLMQMGRQYIPQAAQFDHVFSKKQKRNRVELITDFPEGNDAEVILALQVHPHGHCILSRNISYDEQSEWSCIHDIKEDNGDVTNKGFQPRAKRRRKDTTFLNNNENTEDSTDDENDTNPSPRRRTRAAARRELAAATSNTQIASDSNETVASSRRSPPFRSESFVPDIWAAEVTVQDRAIRQTRARSSNSVTGYNFVYAISSGVLPLESNPSVRANTRRSSYSPANTPRRPSAGDIRLQMPRSTLEPDSNDDTNSNSDSSSSSLGITTPLYQADGVDYTNCFPFRRLRNKREIFQNPKKLMYYFQESNNGKGFIKEPCFSLDGRIVCSPYDTGVRLYNYTKDCTQYVTNDYLIKDRKTDPQELVLIKHIKGHSEMVLSSKFSPRGPLLVTGCRSGKICWYHPVL